MRRNFKTLKREAVKDFEQMYLVSLLRYCDGNVTKSAQESGMLRPALQRLLRKHEIKSSLFRERED